LLASKVEEAHIKAETLAQVSRIPLQRILDQEILVLDSISFHLKVHHLFKPLEAFLDTIKVSFFWWES
jgi:hypothetical protein